MTNHNKYYLFFSIVILLSFSFACSESEEIIKEVEVEKVVKPSGKLVVY